MWSGALDARRIYVMGLEIRAAAQFAYQFAPDFRRVTLVSK